MSPEFQGQFQSQHRRVPGLSQESQHFVYFSRFDGRRRRTRRLGNDRNYAGEGLTLEEISLCP